MDVTAAQRTNGKHDRSLYLIIKLYLMNLQHHPSSIYETLLRNFPSGNAGMPPALLPLQLYEMVAPTINDDLEGTARTSLQLKAREHAASLALMQVRNNF
jgi:hypothetical protein